MQVATCPSLYLTGSLVPVPSRGGVGQVVCGRVRHTACIPGTGERQIRLQDITNILSRYHMHATGRNHTTKFLYEFVQLETCVRSGKACTDYTLETGERDRKDAVTGYLILFWSLRNHAYEKAKQVSAVLAWPGEVVCECQGGSMSHIPSGSLP